jgi:hypothetical protein
MVLNSLWDAAGIAKAKGLRQHAMLQHSKLCMAEGMNSHSLSLSLVITTDTCYNHKCMCVCVCACNCANNQHPTTKTTTTTTTTKGRMVTQEEGACAYHWFCRKWQHQLPELQVYWQHQQLCSKDMEDNYNNDNNNDDDDEPLRPYSSTQKAACMCHEWGVVWDLQHYLIAMLTFLSGGQQLQVYAELLSKDLLHNEDNLLVIHVDAEKVPHQNINCLPLPTQLWATLKYFQQNI